MSDAKARLDQPAVLIVTLAVLVITSLSAFPQGIQHLNTTIPGGLPGLPVMTVPGRATNGVTVTWDGPQGYYQLQQKLDLRSQSWQAIGGPNLNRKTTLTNLHSSAFFRVSGPSPHYAGARSCVECHQGIHTTQASTRHVGAFTNPLFIAQGGQTNASCLVCHTVGYGVPTGFTSVTSMVSTSMLAGVQCENCHGPTANHAANPEDPTFRPRVELAATVCGGCHSGAYAPGTAAQFHPPRYEEWNASTHRAVLPELQEDFEGSQGQSFYISSCGRCHSGTVRAALLEREPLPDGHEAGALGIVCNTCHDPHQVYVRTNALAGLLVITNRLTGRPFAITNDQLGVRYTNQVRHPLASTNDYVLTTSDVFTNKYDPNINVCAQCHNHRGASWTTSSRAPHHSPQYNFLLGTIGELDSGSASATNRYSASHALLEKQCVTCHMQTEDYVSEAERGTGGHKFKVESYGACARCHLTPQNAQALVFFVQTITVSPMIQELKGLLDDWALIKGPGELQSTNDYGKLAWEYTTPGELSEGGPGPNATEQQRIPENIRKARFNLYLVQNDGSYGVHNGPLAVSLLDGALNWVQAEINK